MKIKYLSFSAALVIAVALPVTLAGVASAAPVRPSASGPAYSFRGPYLVARHVQSCTGFKTCASTPFSLMVTSAGLSADFSSTTGNVWQTALRLSWKNGAWHASGTWLVSTCASGKEVPTTVTLVLRETSLQNVNGVSTADNFSGTYTSVQPKSACGVQSEAIEPLSTNVIPSWWNGNCDVNDLPGSYEKASWHGLIACDPGDSYVIPGTPSSGDPLAGDVEWQCAELAQRWLYMAFGIPSVPQGDPSVGGGNTIATTYRDYLKAHPLPGNPLTFEQGSGPLSPGDVISYGDGPPGHVGIVIAVNTHAKTYTIIEQNPAGDTTTLGYNNGVPAGDGKGYPVVGWLHITL